MAKAPKSTAKAKRARPQARVRSTDSTAARSRAVKKKNAGLACELAESRDQLAAVSQILRVISSSRGDVQPVFDAIVKAGARLFKGMNLSLRLVRGDHTDTVASTIPLNATGGALPVPLDESTPSSRAILRRQVVEITDTLRTSKWVSALSKGHARKRGYRALLIAPLLTETAALGAIMLTRPKPGRFEDREVALLKTFAEQAVIAIENVRLFKELQSRNAELTESLEQQTATAEILKVIARSPDNIQPVLDAIAENAARVCGADNSVIRLVQGDIQAAVAHRGS